MATMVFEATSSGMVVGIGTQPPADADWDAYMGAIKASVVDRMPPVTLAFTFGGAPTPAQRRKLDQAVAGGPEFKVAILTDSTFARGVVNAFALLYSGYRAFGLRDLGPATQFLGAGPSAARELEAALYRVRARLGAR